MALLKKQFQCGSCEEITEVPQRVPKPANCPKCGVAGYMIHRLESSPPKGRRRKGEPRRRT